MLSGFLPSMTLFRVSSLLAVGTLILGACEPVSAPARLPDEASTEPEVAADTVRAEAGDYVEFSIFWATDRKQTGDTAPATMFAGERGPLVYGTSRISIPNDHKIGEIERPGYWRFVFGEDPSRHMVLLRGGTEVLEKDPWFLEVQDRAEQGDRTAFVFIHGFNTTFEDAALRTAQIGYDLEFSGAPILYSWPSKGSSRAYPADEGNARWSEAHLVDFLNDIRTRADVDEVTLIAHSLGSRLLGNALVALSNQSGAEGGPLFNEIILSAPDIDADIFKTRIMPAMRKLAQGRTLYASSEDWALIFSREFLRAGQPRAGDSGEQIIVMPGLDTIDATDVRTDFWRHDDISNRPVLRDMYDIVREGKRAGERAYLKEEETGDGTFWRLVP